MEDHVVEILGELLPYGNKEDFNLVLKRYQRVPDYLYTEDFSERFLDISLLRCAIVSARWGSFFDDCCQRMFSSHKTYLTFIMFACLSEQIYHRNVLDSFVSGGLLVLRLILETHDKTGVNFYHLKNDILMVYYKNELKSIFGKRASFQCFEKLIRSHKIVTKKSIEKYLDYGDAIKSFVENSSRKLKNELDGVTRTTITPKEVEIDMKSIELADLVLSIPDIRLPSLPSRSELNKRLLKFRKNEQNIAEEKEKIETPVKCEASNVASSGCPSSNSESKAIHVTEHLDNIEWCENVIQAVIKHNHSKISSNERENGRIMQEAEGILEHLKDSIQSILEALNEYKNE